MPSLDSLQKKFQGKPFDIVLVDVRETSIRLKKFLAKKEYSFSVLMDSDGGVSRMYSVAGFPMKYLIDGRKNIVAIERGYRLWDSSEMETLVNRLIAETTPKKIKKAPPAGNLKPGLPPVK